MAYITDPVTGQTTWVPDSEANKARRDQRSLAAFNQIASPTTASMPAPTPVQLVENEALNKYGLGVTRADLYPKGLNQQQAVESAWSPAVADNAAGSGYSASSANAALDAAAKKYWANVNQYGQQRTNAMRDFYSGLSGATARTGADIARGGQGLAADIEALYERLGQQSQIQPGAAGTVTPQTSYGALTPISGAQATAAQQIPAAGASLADYLGGQQNAAAATFLGTSAAQAAQGQGAISDLVMNIQAARAQEEYNRAQQKIANNQRAAAAAAVGTPAQVLVSLYNAASQGLVASPDTKEGKELNKSAKAAAALVDSNAKAAGVTTGQYISNPNTMAIAQMILGPISAS